MERVTAVSLRATREYIRAVKAVALLRGVDAGDLVRSALDQAYGKDIEKQLVFFADHNRQVDNSIDKAKGRS